MQPIAAATGVAGTFNALKHHHPENRRRAVKELVAQPLDAAIAIRQLRLRLVDADRAVRLLAVRGLERIGRPAVPTLVEALGNADDRVRRESVWALGRLGPAASAAVPALVGVLGDADLGVSQGAARTLGLIGTAAVTAVPALMGLLEKSNYVQCRLAACALAAIGSAAVPALVQGLRADNIYVRCDSIWALGQIGPAARAAVPALVAVLRSRAAECLFKRAGDSTDDQPPLDTTPFFIPARKGTAEAYCLLTIKALGAIGPAASAAVPVLVDLLRDGNGTAQILACQAMRQIEPWTAPEPLR